MVILSIKKKKKSHLEGENSAQSITQSYRY